MLNKKIISLELSENEINLILTSFGKMKEIILKENTFAENWMDRLEYERLVLLEDKISRKI